MYGMHMRSSLCVLWRARSADRRYLTGRPEPCSRANVLLASRVSAR